MTTNTNLLTNKEILTHSWHELQKRFWPLLLVALVGPIATWLLRGLCLGFDPLQNTAQAANLWAMAACSVLTLFVSLWAMTALVLFICKRTNNWQELLKLSLKRMPRLIAGLVLYGLALCICLVIGLLAIIYLAQSAQTGLQILAALVAVALFVALIIVWIYFLLLPYVLILTDIPVWYSMPSAFMLMKNHCLKTLGLLVCVSFISVLISIAIMLIIGILAVLGWFIWPASRYIFGIFTSIPAALALLIYHIPFIALYIDLSNSWQAQEK